MERPAQPRLEQRSRGHGYADLAVTVAPEVGVRIAIRGDLCTRSTPMVADGLRDWTGSDGAAAVTVDLSGVTFIDGRGIALLVELHRHGCRLSDPSDCTTRLAEICGLATLFDDLA